MDMLEYYDNAEFPWTQELEANWKTIRAELDALPEEAFGEWPRHSMVEHDWNLFLFFAPGKRFEKNCSYCPETVKLVDKIPGITMATFSWLRPDSHIKAHKGFSRVVLRSHLALKTPTNPTEETCALRVGSTTKPWQEGKVFVFDDWNEHEAWNHTKEERVVLMIDFLRPFKYRTSTLGYIRQRVMPHPAYRKSYEQVLKEAVGA